MIPFVALLILTKPLWPVVEYVINYDYIVEQLCENRDKPELHCDGSCYLAKQIAKASEGEDKNPFGEKNSRTEIAQHIFAEELPEFHFTNLAETTVKGYGFIPELYTSLLFSKIPHPPRIS